MTLTTPASVSPSSLPTSAVPIAADKPDGRTAVSWSTVLPLAVVLAFGSGFWLISLRGAVGSVDRAQGPFVTWLRESAVAVPAYVFAVLAGLTLAVHLFGPVLRRARAVLGAIGLISVAATLVGIIQAVANAVYDYHLEVQQSHMMAAMRATCAGACRARQDHATLMVQVHGVGYAVGLLLVTNLVLASWMVALRGGRLKAATVRRAKLVAVDRPDRPYARQVQLLLVGLLLGSAVVHTAVVPAHLSEWPVAGVFFMLLTAAEVAVARMVLMDVRRALLFAAAVTLAPLLLWLYSRTAGLPFGPGAGQPEPVGLADSMVALLEFATLLLAVAVLRTQGWLRRPPASAHVRALAVAGILAVTVFGLGGAGLFGSAAAVSSHHSASH
jgi:hypothetical protein